MSNSQIQFPFFDNKVKAVVIVKVASGTEATRVNVVTTAFDHIIKPPTLDEIRTTFDDITKPLDDIVLTTRPVFAAAGTNASTRLVLELVSAELDGHGREKETVKAYVNFDPNYPYPEKLDATFKVPSGFGKAGAILVQNEYDKEVYMESIVLHDYPHSGLVNVSCKSWIHSMKDDSKKRIFFTDKSYLPTETPNGLKRLREEELVNLRGNGQGERKTFERIYDYDKYNDLGDPDSDPDLARPVLGGSKDYPYPRRCRTGRPPTQTDPSSESKGTTSKVYVPRDESFSETKNQSFVTNTLKSMMHGWLPRAEAALFYKDSGFPFFTAIDKLFRHKIEYSPGNPKAFVDDLLLFESPKVFEQDKFSWFRDEEFSRKTLAGMNPFSIQLVREWPLNLDKEKIEKEMKGSMTVEQAIEKKKLFMLDYHDILLPYVAKVRELKGTTLYASRTIFFLEDDGSSLRPLAIELTRPQIGHSPEWRQVYTPSSDATGCWLWRLAKAHVLAHDSGIHQLVSHWLRTHCCVEPYIIAANRQMSEMHPIYRLLGPHFRYTMEINATARDKLINAAGIIESTFSPLKYSIELSSIAYGKLWQFDTEALPADLIKRGLAEKDPAAKHGLKLAIKDYPYADDGLILWDAIKEWVANYVNHYYPEEIKIKDDYELHKWWDEVKTKGHPDKKDGWPVLETKEDLIQILTTIIWVASGHHAAVNFGQYLYAGYFPNQPTIARINMPDENLIDRKGYQNFLEKPQDFLLKSFPTQEQATQVMAILYVLSSHSPDEEYIGNTLAPSWEAEPEIKTAYENFHQQLKDLEVLINERNKDISNKNRAGAGVVPYELLKPSSKPGVTGMGVPNSISI